MTLYRLYCILLSFKYDFKEINSYKLMMKHKKHVKGE